MARNRQRAKQRQAERRARRLADERVDDQSIEDPTAVDPSPAVPPDLAAGAPPQDEGFSGQMVREDSVLGDRPTYDEPPLADEPPLTDEPPLADEPPLTEEEALEEIEDWEVEDPEEAIAEGGAGEAGYEVRGRRGREAAEAHKDRPRVVQFLIAVWAELQRVQWPNRQALVTLTGVVLGPNGDEELYDTRAVLVGLAGFAPAPAADLVARLARAVGLDLLVLDLPVLDLLERLLLRGGNVLVEVPLGLGVDLVLLERVIAAPELLGRGSVDHVGIEAGPAEVRR
ncbi:MAG TPA: preprotein translocase subunit SecE, partial [Solirubrobacterales bacterium]|nr:preprotein translocase subunit SecE [Solirubrobacterales bacterium]